MKKTLFSILLAIGFVSCGPSKQKETELSQPVRTTEAEALLSNLKQIPKKGYMFGHHDDTAYGIGWEFEEGRSDVRSVCGDYPAVISFDLGHIELGDSVSLDKVPFNKIRQEIINQYQRGGMVSLSWHLDNPLTDGDSWDVSDTTVVASILPGGTKHEKFYGWMENLANFLNSLQTPEGTKIPVFFRPWHEHTGSWFWWGQKLCTTEQYKALWHMTHNFLQEKGANHLLYAYSPGTEFTDSTSYLERYPGDEIIDLIGFDTYQSNKETYLKTLERTLPILTEIGKAHNKVIALTETGFEGVKDAKWWTGTLQPAIADYPIAYVLVWRNARERITHFYAPYPGQESAEDFKSFYNDSTTLFANDVKDILYKQTSSK